MQPGYSPLMCRIFVIRGTLPLPEVLPPQMSIGIAVGTKKFDTLASRLPPPHPLDRLAIPTSPLEPAALKLTFWPPLKPPKSRAFTKITHSLSLKGTSLPPLEPPDDGSFLESLWLCTPDLPWAELMWTRSTRKCLSLARRNDPTQPPPTPPDRNFQQVPVEFRVKWGPTMPPPPPKPPDACHRIVVRKTVPFIFFWNLSTHKRDIESGSSNNSISSNFDGKEYSSEPFDISITKNASIQQPTHWRQGELVLNVSCQFGYTSDLQQEEEPKQILWMVIVHIRAIQAACHLNEDENKTSGTIVPTSISTRDFSIREHGNTALSEYGEVIGLSYLLKINLEKGIKGDDVDLVIRRNAIGPTNYPRKKGKSFLMLTWDACKDLSLIIFKVDFVVALALTIKSEGIMEGLLAGGSIADSICGVVIAYRLHAMEKIPTSKEERAHWSALEDDLVLLAIIGLQHPYGVEVFDSKSDYIKLMKSILNFQTVIKLLSAPKIPLCYIAFHEATEAYVKHIIVDEIMALESSLLNCKPMEFGGGHLEPNLTYAKKLVACIGLGNSVMLQYYQECQSKLAKIAGSKKPTSIIKGALYIWSACSSAPVQNYYVNPLINNVFNPKQYSAYDVKAVSSFVKDLNRWGARKVGMISLPPLGCLLAVRTVFGFHERGFWFALSIGKLKRLQFALLVSIVHIVEGDRTSLGRAPTDMELLIEPDSFVAYVKWHESITADTFCKNWKEWTNSYNLEDKVVFNGGSNVMIQNSTWGNTLGIADSVEANGQVAADPNIQGIRRCRKRKNNRIYDIRRKKESFGVMQNLSHPKPSSPEFFSPSL